MLVGLCARVKFYDILVHVLNSSVERVHMQSSTRISSSSKVVAVLRHVVVEHWITSHCSMQLTPHAEPRFDRNAHAFAAALTSTLR